MNANELDIHRNFNDMNAQEFLKEEGINDVDEGCLHYVDDAEWINERILTKLMEDYHQAKLKLLGISGVSKTK